MRPLFCYHQKMAIYGIATILGDSNPGTEFSADELPLHLTHVDSFEINVDLEKLEQALRQKLSSCRAFSVVAVKDVMYGPDKDIEVTELELAPELAHLQAVIVTTLEGLGAKFKNPQFVGQHYSPHISVYGARRVPVGDKVSVKEISIAAKVGTEENDVRRIFATIPLQ